MKCVSCFSEIEGGPRLVTPETAARFFGGRPIYLRRHPAPMRRYPRKNSAQAPRISYFWGSAEAQTAFPSLAVCRVFGSRSLPKQRIERCGGGSACPQYPALLSSLSLSLCGLSLQTSSRTLGKPVDHYSGVGRLKVVHYCCVFIRVGLLVTACAASRVLCFSRLW